MQDPVRKQKAREMAAKYRDLTKEWHASPAGLAWHKAHGLMTWVTRKPINITCKVCDKQSDTKTYHQEFCSNACKSMWRRKNKLDDIDKTCPVCEKQYRSSKYSRSKTCGRSCGKNVNKHIDKNDSENGASVI